MHLRQRLLPQNVQRLEAPRRQYTLAKQRVAANFHVITSGTTGTCGELCAAGAGYDYVTGIGTPLAASLVNVLAAQ